MLEYLHKRDWETATYLFLALANFLIGCYLIYTSPVEIASDAEQYYEISKALVGKGGQLFYDRTNWGYPILLIFTGVPWTRWPLITQLVQVCMASTIPYFVGSSLRQVGVASWINVSAAIFTFLAFPTVFSLALLTNTESEFLFYFTIWLVARALARVEGAANAAVINGKIQWRIASAIGAAFFVLYLVHPENAVIGFVALGLGFAITTKAARGVMLRAIGILIVLTLVWVPLQKSWAAWSETRTKQTFLKGGSLAGMLFFKNVWFGGSIFVGHPAIRPENGRCSSLVYESVERNIRTIGDSIRRMYNRPPATTDEILAVHDTINFPVIWRSLEHDFGPGEMTRIFWCSAFEGIYAEPKSLLYYYDGLVAFFLFDDLIYDNGYRQAWLSADYYATVNVPFWAWAMYVGAVIKVIAFVIAFGTLLPTWQRGGSPRTLAVMLWAMILCTAAVYVVFASPHWRYTEPVIPGLVLLAGLGLQALRSPLGYARVNQSTAFGSGMTSSN